MLTYLIDLLLPLFLSLPPLTCSSPTIIYHLTIVNKPQWSGRTLYIHPLCCIIFYHFMYSYTCSSRTLLFNLALLYQPQWSGATLAIPPHHLIIFRPPMVPFY